MVLAVTTLCVGTLVCLYTTLAIVSCASGNSNASWRGLRSNFKLNNASLASQSASFSAADRAFFSAIKADFRIMKSLGRGSFGKVVLAERNNDRGLVAIKWVPTDLMFQNDVRRQKEFRHQACVALINEYETVTTHLTTASSVNIIKYYSLEKVITRTPGPYESADHYCAGPVTPYIVMEFAEKSDLFGEMEDALQNNTSTGSVVAKPLDEDRSKCVLWQLFSGLNGIGK